MKAKRKTTKAKPKTAAKRKKTMHAKPKTDAITLLKSDHKEVAAWFREYEHGKDSKSASRKEKLATKICEALTVHARIEEELFYPAVRETLGDEAAELLAEAKVEHNSLKRLIADIEESKPGSDEYDADVKVLGEYVNHHVEEEEDELFPKVRKSYLDLKALGAEMLERKKELTGRLKGRRPSRDAGGFELMGGGFVG